MGCFASTLSDGGGNRRRLKSIGELAIFVPGFRIPIAIDFTQPLGDSLPKSLVNRLSALRTRIVSMAMHEAATATKLKQKKITRNGTSTFSDLLQALEDYLPVLLGLTKDGRLKVKVKFAWINQEDDDEQTAIANVWYEVLSVLHLMAMLCLAEANYLLLPRKSNDGYQQQVSEENRRRSIDVLLKAAGYLDCSIHQVLPQIPLELRRNLPVDLSEEELNALCMQALGQGVDIQLEMAIDSPKATLAVKRRLACEMVKYFNQAQDSILKIQFSGGWGEKHRLFLKWKYAEAKAAAYYYHAMILDEGNSEESHGMAVAALRAAEEFLKESKRACEVFNVAPPTSRNPPPWGSMKYLSYKITKDASSKAHANQVVYSQERILQDAPALPDFALALNPEEYQLPPLDPIWNTVTSTTEDLNRNKLTPTSPLPEMQFPATERK
ncbi:uncharacterized protein LOC110038583 [Phalaenopsis equestris]|uniref:uncharacterized protein LOC110038583 n=1 Tax=Phalaenopsis equestris TaxID=78828 RepID=UPI0009E5CB25|nr:uncharacterized protein LOC110038583 [Phalaenopsis equestris]